MTGLVSSLLFPKLHVKGYRGTSLALQWLRLHTSNARGPGFSPWSGNQIPHAATKSSHTPQLKILSAVTKTWCSQRNISQNRSNYKNKHTYKACGIQAGREHWNPKTPHVSPGLHDNWYLDDIKSMSHYKTGIIFLNHWQFSYMCSSSMEMPLFLFYKVTTHALVREEAVSQLLWKKINLLTLNSLNNFFFSRITCQRSSTVLRTV